MANEEQPTTERKESTQHGTVTRRHTESTPTEAAPSEASEPSVEPAAVVTENAPEAPAEARKASEPQAADISKAQDEPQDQGAPHKQKRGKKRGRKMVRDVPKKREKAVVLGESSEDQWKKRAAAGDNASFADLLGNERMDTRMERQKLSVGDEVEGTVVHASDQGLFLDLGGMRNQAFFPRLELSEKDAALNTGDTLKAYVVRFDKGNAVLGYGLSGGRSAEDLRQAMEENIPVDGKVTGVNKGGVSVDIGGIRAFCPMGQLELRYVSDASVYLNKTLQFHVTEIRDERDVVVSRRAILESQKEAHRAELIATLTPGTIAKGRVARVVDFGAFVDLGGIDGLIPTRELSYDRVRPDQVVAQGQEVEVMVQEVQEKGDDLRITLSLKALGTDPWDTLDTIAPPGVVISGSVRRIMDFGAFVELAPGVEGLLHVSELGARSAQEALNVGEKVRVTVQSIDREKKRISLVPAPEGAEAGVRVSAPTFKQGSVVDVVAEEYANFGVFVQVDGVPGRAGRGLVHVKELGLEHGQDMKKAYPLGKTFKAKIIDVRRLSLSVKAIAEDEERATLAQYQQKAKSSTMGTLGDLLKNSMKK